MCTAAAQDAQLICDGIINSVTLKPLPQLHHGDTAAQAATAAAFLRRLQPRQATQMAGHGAGGCSGIGGGNSCSSGSGNGSTAGRLACDALSLCWEGFSASELAAWLQGPIGSVQPLPAVGRLVVEQAAHEPLLDSSVMRLAALVPNARHASFECVLPAGLGPALAYHCRQLTSLELQAKTQPASLPGMAPPPGSIGQVLSGLASLPSLDCLTHNKRIILELPAPRSIHSLAGPVTLRTLVWKESGWDWGDAALMQRLSSALPRLASLDLTFFPFDGMNEGIYAISAHHLRDCFLSLTELKLWAIDGNCWVHVLAHLPALQAVNCFSGKLLDGWDGAVGRIGGTAGSTTSVPHALPALPHVQHLTVQHLSVGEVPRLQQMLRALPRLQRLCVPLVTISSGDIAACAAAELASLPLRLQELHAALARHGGEPMDFHLTGCPDADTAATALGAPIVTLSSAVQQWPVLPLITSLDARSLEAVQQDQGSRGHEAPVASSNCSRVAPATELAARLKRCFPCLRDLRLRGSLGLTLTPSGVVPGNDDGGLPRTLLELALGLPWSLRTLIVSPSCSGLTRAQLQGLLQGLADAGRRDLGIELRVLGVVPAPDAALGTQELRVCLRRVGLEVRQCV